MFDDAIDGLFIGLSTAMFAYYSVYIAYMILFRLQRAEIITRPDSL
ncbi:MAG: hypothetical protein ABI972_03590 [Acidobacteriota bacterium]